MEPERRSPQIAPQRSILVQCLEDALDPRDMRGVQPAGIAAPEEAPQAGVRGVFNRH